MNMQEGYVMPVPPHFDSGKNSLAARTAFWPLALQIRDPVRPRVPSVHAGVLWHMRTQIILRRFVQISCFGEEKDSIKRKNVMRKSMNLCIAFGSRCSPAALSHSSRRRKSSTLAAAHKIMAAAEAESERIIGPPSSPWSQDLEDAINSGRIAGHDWRGFRRNAGRASDHCG